MNPKNHIEEKLSKIVVPAAFGDLFYGLRGHVCFVRNTLQTAPPTPAPAPAAPEASGQTVA